jgi:hypothetical protein
MGMFDKDKSFGVDVTSVFQLGTPFLLWGAEVLPEPVETSLGDARKTRLIVSTLEQPELHREVTTLASAIADKAAEAAPDDFPCKVELRKVDSSYGGEALVLQWLDNVDDALAGLGGGRMNHATGEVAADAPASKRGGRKQPADAAA